jgi:zinc transport system ATP-binding protein
MSKVDHNKNIIEFENISFSYGEEIVLKDINLAIHQGDYLAIVGPNGGGKTTLLKIMLGLLQPTQGKVKLFGHDLKKFKQWSKIGYVPQKVTNFDPNFPATVEEVVMMGRFAKRGLLHMTTPEDHQKVTEALRKVEMLRFAKRLIGDLSGGQQQRVFIARALVSDPEMIVLDEPTTGIDEKAQQEFYALLRRLNQDDELTLVYVSHDQELAERESTEIAHVNQTLSYTINYPHA